MTSPWPFPHQPDFVDNQDGNTLESALRARLEHFRDNNKNAIDVCIATGYFNLKGSPVSPSRWSHAARSGCC